MSFDLSIVIPEGVDINRVQLADEIEALFKFQGLVDEFTIPSKMPIEQIVAMLETVMFPYYPSVKQSYQAFCAKYTYQDEPLQPKVAGEFWHLMTARELASLSLRAHHEDSLVSALYVQVVRFVKKHNLAIFNPQAQELEDLATARDFPRYWNEEE